MRQNNQFQGLTFSAPNNMATRHVNYLIDNDTNPGLLSQNNQLINMRSFNNSNVNPLQNININNSNFIVQPNSNRLRSVRILPNNATVIQSIIPPIVPINPSHNNARNNLNNISSVLQTLSNHQLSMVAHAHINSNNLNNNINTKSISHINLLNNIDSANIIYSVCSGISQMNSAHTQTISCQNPFSMHLSSTSTNLFIPQTKDLCHSAYLAFREFNLGNYGACEIYCNNWLVEQGETYQCYTLMCFIYLRLRNYKKLEEHAHKILKLNTSIVEPYVFLGICCKETNRIAESLNYYKLALQLHPENIDSLIGLSNCYLTMGDLNSAANILVIGINRYPDSVVLRHEFANIYRACGKHDDALKCSENVLEMNPGFAPAWFMAAQSHLSLNNIWLSLHYFERAISADPYQLDAYLIYGNILREIKLLDKSIKCYLKGLSYFPEIAQLYGGLGCACLENNMIDAAIENFKRALTIFPNYPDVLCNLANALKDKGLIDDAEIHYFNAIKICPSHADSYNNLANILRERGKIHESIQFYKKSLEIQPNFAAAHSNLATVLQQCGKINESITHFICALNSNPTNPDIHCYLGNAYKEIGNYKLAIDCFLKAINLNTFSPDSHAFLANTYKDMGYIMEAICEFNTALSYRPNFPEVFCGLVHSFLLVANWKNYKENCERVVKIVEEQIINKKPPSVHPHHTMLFDMRAELRVEIAKKHAIACLERCLFLGYKPKNWSFGTNSYNISNNINHISHLNNSLNITNNNLSNFNNCNNFANIPDLPPDNYLKIGYISSDFCNHPTSHLIQSIPGLHDRSRFKVYCYSLTQSDQSSFRIKIESEVDYFIDVSNIIDPNEISIMIQNHGIHILLNLNGYTKGARNEIFALKPAPIQIMYLGYPGTSGSDYMDYIITDKIVSPLSLANHYSEKFAYMPNSFFIGDHAQLFPHILKDLTIEQNIINRLKNYQIYIKWEAKSNNDQNNQNLNNARNFKCQKNCSNNKNNQNNTLNLVNNNSNNLNNCKNNDYNNNNDKCDNNSNDHDKIKYLSQIDSHIKIDKYVKYHCKKRSEDFQNAKNSGEKIPEPIVPNLSRSQLGIPENAFVYCNFNQIYKLDPTTFDAWVEILQKVPNSYLWLLRFPKYGEDHIRDYFRKFNMEQTRLVFTEVSIKEEHVRRGQLADVCLDTPLCNGHTTGMDVLWAGCPIVTLPLKTFASRVGASIISAIGLGSELIADSYEQYIEISVKLGTNRQYYNKIKAILWYGRITSPLFDVRTYAKDFDALLLKIWQSYKKKRQIDHISLDPPN